MRLGFHRLAAPEQGNSPVAVDEGIVRIEYQRLAEAGIRFGQFAQAVENHSPEDPSFQEIRSKRQRPGQVRLGLLQLAQVQENHTQVAVGKGKDTAAKSGVK